MVYIAELKQQLSVTMIWYKHDNIKYTWKAYQLKDETSHDEAYTRVCEWVQFNNYKSESKIF